MSHIRRVWFPNLGWEDFLPPTLPREEKRKFLVNKSSGWDATVKAACLADVGWVGSVEGSSIDRLNRKSRFFHQETRESRCNKRWIIGQLISIRYKLNRNRFSKSLICLQRSHLFNTVSNWTSRQSKLRPIIASFETLRFLARNNSSREDCRESCISSLS